MAIEALRKTLESAKEDLKLLGKIKATEDFTADSHDRAIARAVAGHREGKRKARRWAKASRHKLQGDPEYNARINSVMQVIDDLAAGAKRHIETTQRFHKDRQSIKYYVYPQVMTGAKDSLGVDADPQVRNVVEEMGTLCARAERMGAREVEVAININRLYGKPSRVNLFLDCHQVDPKDRVLIFHFGVQRLMAGLQVEGGIWENTPFGGLDHAFNAEEGFNSLDDAQKLEVIATFLMSAAKLPPVTSRETR